MDRNRETLKLGDITQPLVELLNDAEHAESLLDEHDSQFYRRSYVRSTIAAIEGIIWLLKQVCLKAVAGAQVKISVAEFAMLSDVTYELKNNGDVKTQTKFLKLLDNLRFTINVCNRIFGTDVDLEVKTAAWQDFQAAIAIRNRITHPKSASELEISNEEIEICKRVVGWFNDKIYRFVDTLTKRPQTESGEK